MTENEQKNDIHERMFQWVIAVLKFIDKIPKTVKTIPIISQLTDSITSVGANDKEANSATTVKDFCHKYGIVKKEADESIYWLRLIGELFDRLQQESKKLQNEGQEIIKIVATIIRNSQKTSQMRKLQAKGKSLC